MRKSLLIAVFVVLGGLAVPAQAQFCPGVSPWVFDDVPAADPFCGYITEMAARGVTLGCTIIDANHRLYCPSANVTRTQMAAFMSRLGGSLFPTTCNAGQVMKWNGVAWACANDIDSNSGGTVTSLTAGTGLTGGTITSSGTIAADTIYLQRRVSGSCVAGSNIRAIAADGTVTCQSDANSGGTVTSVTAGAGLTGGTITGSGTIAVDPTSTTLTGSYFRQGGNAFAATAVLGTTDNNPVEIRANGAQVMRYVPNGVSPNIVGGHSNNAVNIANIGSTIGGGGGAGNTCFDPPSGTSNRSCGNQSSGDSSTIGGGYANRATSTFGGATVGGGQNNTANGGGSTVGGGNGNWANGITSTVGGGQSNTAIDGAAVGGGESNAATGIYSTVSGGYLNTASGLYAAVGGGYSNIASGNFSFAVGTFAKTQSAGVSPIVHHGTFVFGDSQPFSFNSAATNEFAVRSTGGARFVTAVDGSGNPTRTVKINGNGELDFGAQTRQMFNLYSATYGIGVQAYTQYFRTDAGFAWFERGVHSDTQFDPGAGGSVLMTLQQGGSVTTVTGTARALSFVSTSDRNVKTNFVPLDSKEVLDKVVALPVTTWAYRSDAATRHMGPVAQDFHAAFGLGDDDRAINHLDESGVALAAIQGLNAKVEALAAVLTAREARIATLESTVATMRTDQHSELAQLRALVETLLAARDMPQLAQLRH